MQVGGNRQTPVRAAVIWLTRVLTFCLGNPGYFYLFSVRCVGNLNGCFKYSPAHNTQVRFPASHGAPTTMNAPQLIGCAFIGSPVLSASSSMDRRSACGQLNFGSFVLRSIIPVVSLTVSSLRRNLPMRGEYGACPSRKKATRQSGQAFRLGTSI